MRLRLASRKSDLARWQAVQVGRTLEQLPEKPSIEFIFKASLGDQNLDVPLASMGAKGRILPRTFTVIWSVGSATWSFTLGKTFPLRSGPTRILP
ncbi:MAG: hypothetical protein HC902_02930 [Calothrix sp. SM1_5_4]|nr:hypothetical protein [Calothrix sp. SM1_5_4]